MRRNRTLIAHFYNEEYLLPWWLTHHLPMFDRAILINRGSTDRSVALCRDLAPTWEVRDATVPEFDALDVDREVMDIEREVSGWKMTLNITEFLCTREPNHLFESLETLGHSSYVIPLIMMVDDPSYGYRDPVYSDPLVMQRHHGFSLASVSTPYSVGRFVHRRRDGRYGPGRHGSANAFTEYTSPPNLAPAFVLKFYYSPWNTTMRQRKASFGPTLSARSRAQGLGFQHLYTEEQLEREYMEVAKQTVDLRSLPLYRRIFAARSADAVIRARP